MTISRITTCVIVCGLAVLGGCSGNRKEREQERALGAGTMSLNMRSEAFQEGHAIPQRHTGEGEDLSPQLSWSQVPAGTKELALVVDDPDAPQSDAWVHWLLYNIPASATELKEGIPPTPNPETPAGAAQGKNSWGTVGYRGPLPPKMHGTHHYHFKLYALDAALGLAPGLDKHDLLNALSGHILGHGELVGTYKR